jgi:hypothetical protein
MSDASGRMPSAQVSQTRAPALYQYLKDREPFSKSGALPSNITRVQGGRANHGAVLDFAVVLELVGILIVIVMMLCLRISD